MATARNHKSNNFIKEHIKPIHRNKLISDAKDVSWHLIVTEH